MTEKEKTSICYLSFPDSYSGKLSLASTTFTTVTLPETAHFYGYVYFRQVKDVSVKRGYFQKSLVLVSRLPYTHLFHSLMQTIAPEFFEKHEPCLEAVCNEIDQWPSPVPGQTLNLPVMGVILQVRREVAWLTGDRRDVVYRCLCVFPVHSNPPADYGVSVVTMITVCVHSSISPLKFCCDFRPYFTIHDSEFREYTTRTQAPPSVVLGVTNPFFIKTFQSWPHIVRLGEVKMAGTPYSSSSCMFTVSFLSV
uniref:DENN/MADD domain containing 6B n=1 Tax=Neolamprologus brichardi TaxID=32507 RepID=A0A3Q4HUC6_NEOBR